MESTGGELPGGSGLSGLQEEGASWALRVPESQSCWTQGEIQGPHHTSPWKRSMRAHAGELHRCSTLTAQWGNLKVCPCYFLPYPSFIHPSDPTWTETELWCLNSRCLPVLYFYRNILKPSTKRFFHDAWDVSIWILFIWFKHCLPKIFLRKRRISLGRI